MTTTTQTTTATLTYGDRVYSLIHKQWVRFSHMADSTYAAVTDDDGRELPDLVHVALLTLNPAL